jgi:hypothetical protein
MANPFQSSSSLCASFHVNNGGQVMRFSWTDDSVSVYSTNIGTSPHGRSEKLFSRKLYCICRKICRSDAPDAGDAFAHDVSSESRLLSLYHVGA